MEDIVVGEAASSVGERVTRLLARSKHSELVVAEILNVSSDESVMDAANRKADWTPSEIVAVADALGVPPTVLAGQVPIDRHLGVSLRLGATAEAGVPTEALEAAERLLGYKSLLDSWLHPVPNGLAKMPMSTDAFAIGAGRQSAERVRDALGLGSDPIDDIAGLIESLGFPCAFVALPQDIHGLNIKDERAGVGSRLILVAKDVSWTKQRYTLAHELAHALYDDTGQFIVDRVEVPEVLTEIRAESFARHLLLPSDALAADVRSWRKQGADWAVVTARLMIRWGVSLPTTIKALRDDQLTPADELDAISAARVSDLMRTADLSEQWSEMCADEAVASGSPMLLDRAVEAYSNGWVDVHVVADLLGRSVEDTRTLLRSQGWEPETIRSTGESPLS